MPDAAEVARESMLQGATSDPAAVSWGSGRIDLFVRGADNAVWHKYFANSQWSAWASLGGSLASGPAVSSWGAGRLDVFARGSDNTLQHTWFDQAWAGRWESLGGGITADPAAVAWGVNRIDVFVRGTDNALYHKYFNGAWSGWEGLGGVLASGPAVSSWGPDRLDVFVRGTDNALHHTWFDRAWSGTWESLGGSLNSDPSAVSWGSGRIDVFARGSDNVLKHRWWGGSWSAWENLGAYIASGPDATSWGPGRLDVFARGSDNVVAQMSFTGAWSGWTGIETQTTASTPTVPVSITGTPQALVVAWPAVTNVEYYKIDRFKENDTCCNKSVTVSPPATSTTDAVSSSLEGAYQYRVTAMMPSRAMVILQGTYYVYGKLDVELAPPINRNNVKVVDPCAPAQVTGGVPPATVMAYSEQATRAAVRWDSIPGAAAYLVERQHRTDANKWFRLGCVSAAYVSFRETTRLDVPRDETFYPFAGAAYKYKITAFSTSGAAGWNSTTLAVSQDPVGPGGPLTASRTGNSVTLCWKSNNTTQNRAERFRIKSSYGTDHSVAGNTNCVTELGVPMGTHTFKVTGLHTAIPTYLETLGPSVTVSVVP